MIWCNEDGIFILGFFVIILKQFDKLCPILVLAHVKLKELDYGMNILRPSIHIFINYVLKHL